MHFSRRTNFVLFSLLLILNIILRLQAVGREIGIDSFLMHMMINSLTEYGHAKWILNPLSLAGLYPNSYASTTLFLVSGIQQLIGLEMNSIIFIFDISLSAVSVFSMYIMAGALIDDDLYKHIVTIIFSTTPAIVDYTTYTLGTRPLLVVLVPLLIYIFLKIRELYKQALLLFLFIPFLFMTHHLFYFLIPSLVIYIILKVSSKANVDVYDFLFRRVPEKYFYLTIILIPIILFLLFFSVPTVFKKFLETGSRYDLPISEYIRYVGPSIIYSIGGFVYLIFKQKKSFSEWLLLASTMSLASFIYVVTYMKWFINLFLIPLAGIGIINFLKTQNEKHIISLFLIVILIVPILFTGYYSFIHVYRDDGYYGRYIEESTYSTGLWIKEFGVGNAISNNQIFSYRIAAVSDTTHFIIPFSTIAAIYDFVDTNMSDFQRYPLSSDQFWFDGYIGPDLGANLWYNLHKLIEPPDNFELNYVVEDTKTNGNVFWNHDGFPSKLLKYAYDKNLICDSGRIKTWEI